MFRRNDQGSRVLTLTGATDDSAKTAHPRRSSGQTIIGSHTRFRGTLKGSGPLLVLGSVEGEITLDGDLTVTAGGQVEADVEVQCLELSGKARGTMKVTERAHIGPTGTFEGEIATPVLDMHPGSVLRGRASVAGLDPLARRKE